MYWNSYPLLEFDNRLMTTVLSQLSPSAGSKKLKNGPKASFFGGSKNLKKTRFFVIFDPKNSDFWGSKKDPQNHEKRVKNS